MIAGPSCRERLTMSNGAHDLARRLTRNAEAVCRYYLSNGRRSGRYWVVGNIMNTPGRSMYVRLFGPEIGKGAAGKWTDAATGEHGDLLDIIGRQHGLTHFPDIASEAWRFLGMPRVDAHPAPSAHSGGSAAGRIAGIGAPSVRDVAADCEHNRRNVSARTRHYGFARNRQPPLPPKLLLPSGARRAY